MQSDYIGLYRISINGLMQSKELFDSLGVLGSYAGGKRDAAQGLNWCI